MPISTIPTSGLSSDQGVNFRNLIINGDMSIAQRSTSKSSITGAGYHTIDRYQIYLATLGTWTMSQSTDVPTGQGFAKSLKFDCTTADASPSANDEFYLRQKFEGQNLQHLKYGTSSAESLTLSFWVKCNKATTATCMLQDHDNSKIQVKSYTISSANTWEKKTVTFSGNTSNSLNNDNGLSLDVRWWLDSGSSFTSGTPTGNWESNVNSVKNPNNLALASSTSNEWYITGVQLEVGTTASDFEFLPYDVNLQRCKRYYVKDTGNIRLFLGNSGDNGARYGNLHFPTTMRSAPSLTAVVDAGGSINFASISTGSASMLVGGAVNSTTFLDGGYQADSEL